MAQHFLKRIFSEDAQWIKHETMEQRTIRIVLKAQ
jgi:hypothetical protein